MRRQLTGDARKLAGAIGDIHYLGGGTSAAAAASACWLTLRYALDGLRDFSGRKVVVLFSENPGVSGPWDRVTADAAHAAHTAAAAVYTVHPLAGAGCGRGGSARRAGIACPRYRRVVLHGFRAGPGE